MEDHADFFISRTGADAPFADRIGRILEDAGYQVVLQQWDFANRNFMERMHAALSSGARVIALLSNEYLASEHCEAEWANAIAADPLNNKARLIVLRVAECTPRGLLTALAYWDLVPIRDQPDLLRDIVLAAVAPGRRKGEGPGPGQYWRAARTVLGPREEIRPTPGFTGRADELVTIGNVLRAGQTAAVYGLGGSASPSWRANTPIGRERTMRACGGSTPHGQTAAKPGTSWRSASSRSAASSFAAWIRPRIAPRPPARRWSSLRVEGSPNPGCLSTTISTTRRCCANGDRPKMCGFWQPAGLAPGRPALPRWKSRNGRCPRRSTICAGKAGAAILPRRMRRPSRQRSAACRWRCPTPPPTSTRTKTRQPRAI
jgi:hypothetical protein